jgi:hypothetical protein
MTESRLRTADTTAAGRHTTRDPGPGWVVFAGVMLLLVGAFNVVVGLVALFRSDVLVSAPAGLIVFSISGWGWIHLIGGVLLVLTGLGVFSGNAIARVAAVVLAGLNAVAQLTFLPVYPLWAVIVIVLDVVVIAALLARGTTPVD